MTYQMAYVVNTPVSGPRDVFVIEGDPATDGTVRVQDRTDQTTWWVRPDELLV